MTTAITTTNYSTHAQLLALPASLLLGSLLGALAGSLQLFAHGLSPDYLMAATQTLIIASLSLSLGLLLARLFRALHSHSKPLNRLYTLAASLAALYAAWIAWISNFILHFGQTPLPRFFTPLRLFDIISSMNQVGTWSLAGKPLHGLPLTLLWSAESLALITLTLRITEWKSPKSTK